MNALIKSAAAEIEQPVSSSTALVVLDKKSIPTIIDADKDGLLSALSAKIRAHKPDASTVKGRDAIRSLAYEVRTTKTAVVKLSNGLTEDWRKKTALVVAERKVFEENMDNLSDEVRQPLTEYENAEKDRAAGHEKALAAICEAPGFYAAGRNTAADLTLRLQALADTPYRDWQEFGERAAELLASEISQANAALAVALKSEADAAELAQLRAEAEERRRQEAEREAAREKARVEAEAAERARLAAEAEAHRLIAEEKQRLAQAEQAALAEVERAEQQRVEAEHRAAQAERDLAEAKLQAERDAAEREARAAREASARALEAELLAEQQAERAERARIEAETKADIEQKAAVKAERDRAAKEKAEQNEADAKRAANIAHCRKINNKAVADFVSVGLAEDVARAVVTAIARGAIAAVSIKY